MRAILRAGLLHPVREVDTDDARRTGRGLMREEPARQRPVEGRLLELQSSVGNAAVERYLQAGEETGVAVQRAPDGTADGGGAPGPAGPAMDAPTQPAGTVDGGLGGEAPTGDGVLRFGDKGEEVRTLQTRLNRASSSRVKLAVDGDFGRLTQAAVRRFQAAHPPLKVDGDAGPDTLAELDRTNPWTAEDVDRSAAEQLARSGREHYGEGRYGAAYDDFTKAWEVRPDPSLLWNRARALHLAGGRREEAIRLYEAFLATDADADEERSQARTHMEELRGPGRSGDRSLDLAMVKTHHRMGAEEYRAERYARAYDEFSKAWEIGGDLAMLWNRAHALRLLGGRRAEAIALYEEFLKLIGPDVSDETKKSAMEHIAELRGPGRGKDAAVNKQAAREAFQAGRDHYAGGEYVKAYDKFSVAWEIDPDPAYLFNRAVVLAKVGGRRDEALALYQEFLTLHVDDAMKAEAQARITELRGPGRTAPPDTRTG